MNEVIQFSVVQDSAGSEIPAQDAAILEFELIELTERYLRIQINFAKPEAISQNVIAPDLLEIELKLGDIFIDSETYPHHFCRIDAQIRMIIFYGCQHLFVQTCRSLLYHFGIIFYSFQIVLVILLRFAQNQWVLLF